MEKIKSLLKKSNTFNCGVRLYCRTYSSIFAGGNRSENKVQTASTASSLSTTNAGTETTSVSATEKTTQNPTDSAKSNKDKKDRKNSEDKKNSKDNSQNSNGSAVEKSEKSEQSSNNSSSDKKKPSSSSNSSSKPTNKRMMFSRQHRISTKPIPHRRESQSRLNRKNRKQKIQIFIVPLQSPVQQFLTTWMTLIPKKLNSFQRTV